MLTDEGLLYKREAWSGLQRVYRFGKYGVSAINGKAIRSYPYAWECAIIRFTIGEQFTLDYSTPMTDDFEVFMTDEETNEFILKVKAWSEGESNGRTKES